MFRGQTETVSCRRCPSLKTACFHRVTSVDIEKPFHFSQKSTTSSRHFSVSNNHHIISLCYEVSPIHMHHLFALLLLVDWVGREQRAYPVTVL